MDPRLWLAVAADLAGRQGEEWWRASASRSYYALFQVGSRLLDHCGFRIPDSERAHAFLWLRLSNCGEPDIAEVSRTLSDLRRLRNLADYSLTATFSRRTAERCHERATAAIDTLDEAASDPEVLARMTTGMRTYERDVLRDETWRGT